MDEYTEQIKNYILEQQRAGYTLEVVKEHLHTHNVPEDVIAHAFAAIDAASSPPSQEAWQQPPAQYAQPLTQPYEQPAQTAAVPASSGNGKKPSLNPIPYLFTGVKNLFSTNAVPLLLALFVSGLVNTIALIGIEFFMVTRMLPGAISGMFSAVIALVGMVVGLYVVLILINAFFMPMLCHIILKGVRHQRTTFGQAAKLGKDRYLLFLKSCALILGVYVASFVIIAIIGTQIAPLAILLGVAMLVISIIAWFRLLYLPLVIADNEKPSGAVAAIRKSSDIWQHSPGATFCYLLFLFLLSFALAIATGDHSQSGSGPAATSAVALSRAGPFTSLPFFVTGAAIGTVVLSVSIGIVVAYAIMTAFLSGLVRIYTIVNPEPSANNPSPQQYNQY
jgi:hypothetical protein